MILDQRNVLLNLELEEWDKQVLLSLLLDAAAGVEDLYLQGALPSLYFLQAQQNEQVALVRVVFDCILDYAEQGKLKVLPVRLELVVLEDFLPQDLDVDLPALDRRGELSNEVSDEILRVLGD